MTEEDAMKILAKRIFGDATNWRTVEEAIRDIVRAMEGKAPTFGRMIDADKLIQAFEAEEDAKECQWTLYGVKRKIEEVLEQEGKNERL